MPRKFNFQKPCLFAFHDSHPQKLKISSNLSQSSLHFISKTSQRYFLTHFFYLFLWFFLDFLKPRVGVYFCVGLGKLTFLQKILILMIGPSPILFVDDCVGPMRHFEHVFKAYFRIFMHCFSYKVIVCMLSV